jgi:hypothetical protein
LGRRTGSEDVELCAHCLGFYSARRAWSVCTGRPATLSVSAAAPAPGPAGRQRLSVLFARLLSQPTYPRCTTPATSASISIYLQQPVHVHCPLYLSPCISRQQPVQVPWARSTGDVALPAYHASARCRPACVTITTETERGGEERPIGAARGGLFLFRRARASDDPRHALGLVAVAGVAHLSVGLTRGSGGKDAHSPQAPNNFFDAKEMLLR